MAKINHYLTAPTFLFNTSGDKKAFQTQEEVDLAWEEGWYGPKNLAKTSPLLSSIDWASKDKMIAAVEGDPRYKGLKLDGRAKRDTVLLAIMEFEEEMGNTPEPEDEVE
jgi:hypothetical protein